MSSDGSMSTMARQPFRVVSDNSSHHLVEDQYAESLPLGKVSVQATISALEMAKPFPSMDSIPQSTLTHPQEQPFDIEVPRRSSGSSSISESSKLESPSSISHRLDSVISPSLHIQTQTLGSALGINTTASTSSMAASASNVASTSTASAATYTSIAASRRGNRTNQKQSSHKNSAPPPVWARRPSLPTMPSVGNRMSVASVSSFDSLPEGETVPHFATSPLGRSTQEQHRIKGDVNDKRRSKSSDRSIASSSSSALPTIDHEDASESLASTSADDFKKRRHVAMELLQTEQVYLASLRLINDNYYQPLVAHSRGMPSNKVESLSTAAPVLSRKAINEIFSNFVDILHLNLELLSRLDERLSGRSREAPSSRPASIATSASESPKGDEEGRKPWDPEGDCIGDLLVPMAPFLKMYSLYVKNFSSALTRIETERKSNESFARFLKETEKATWGRASNSGGFGFGLGFQAHLLTIVQRIPRYKLLVGDLVRCTPSTHRDYSDLSRAYAVIDQVATSINDHIRQHEIVLVMLGIQRSLIGLTEPLIAPGRSLLKRATMLKACRKNIQSREFFLFTDCLVYAAPINGSIDAASAAWQAFSRYGVPENAIASPFIGPTSPRMIEKKLIGGEATSIHQGRDHIRVRTRTMSGPSQYSVNRHSASLEGQQLQFRAKYSLQDCTVVAVDDVVSSDPSLRHCLEIRTPGKSFAVYVDTFEIKMQWLTAIRNAREEWVSNRRTLHAEEDSIQAKRDRRRSLQVVAPTSRSNPSSGAVRKSSLGFDGLSRGVATESTSDLQNLGRLSHQSSATSLFRVDSNLQSVLGGVNKIKALKVLDEYNAPVWVPDSRADRCACCNEYFGIWRRKHHCRLCGQVVCWACSSKTFLIASYEEGEEDRPARACDTCYESVFPDTPEVTSNVAVSIVSENSEISLRRPSLGRPDSEISIDNTPPTPTSPSLSSSNGGQSSTTLPMDSAEIVVSNEIDNAPSDESTSQAPQDSSASSLPFFPARPFPRRYSQMPSKVTQSRGADTHLLRGNFLSPHVQAATSGLGTFRLVTPRLTTPEAEQSAAFSLPPSASLANISTRDIDGSHLDSPASASGRITMNDYFAGATPGQSELRKSDSRSSIPIQQTSSAFPRKKPLSAAARLSFFYNGLSNSSSMSNLSSKT